MNMVLTARQLDRLRKLSPDHKLITARASSTAFSSNHPSSSSALCSTFSMPWLRRQSRGCRAAGARDGACDSRALRTGELLGATRSSVAVRSEAEINVVHRLRLPFQPQRIAGLLVLKKELDEDDAALAVGTD